MSLKHSFVSLFLVILLPVFCIRCHSLDALRSPQEAGTDKEALETLAYRLYEVRIKSEMIPIEALRNFVKKELTDLNAYFDPRELIALFPLLRLKPGTRLVYYYDGNPHWDGIGRVLVIEDGKPVLLNSPEAYMKYVDFEKTPEGCLQYALLREELGLLTLKQHLNYSQSWFIPSYEVFLRICSDKVKDPLTGKSSSWYDSMLPKLPGEGKHDSFWRKLRRAGSSLMPRVTMDGTTARIVIHRFSPFGGVYRAEYTIDTANRAFFQEKGQWSFPIDRTGKFIVPFFCGIMF